MDKLMQKKSILISIGLVVIAAVWLNLFFFSNISKTKAARTEQIRLSQDINANRSQISNVGDIMGRVDLARNELNHKLDNICSVDSIPDFIAKLKASKSTYGLRDLTIKPKVPDLLENMQIPIGDKTFDLVEFEIRGVGRYLNIGQFLEQLHSEPYFNEASAISISYNKSLNPNVLFSLKISTYIRMQG